MVSDIIRRILISVLSIYNQPIKAYYFRLAFYLYQVSFLLSFYWIFFIDFDVLCIFFATIVNLRLLGLALILKM